MNRSRNPTARGRGRGGISKSTPTRKKAPAARTARVVIPYNRVHYLPAQSIYFGKIEAWDEEKLVVGAKSLSFGPDFAIQDKHLEAIIAAGPEFCASTLDFRFGNDENGYGSSITDATIINFVTACPNLIHISLESACSLTDASLSAIFSNCPNIQFISICGNDKIKGRITGAALNELKENKTLAKGLRELWLVDQGRIKDTVFKGLSSKRKALTIKTGETDKWEGTEVTTWLGGKRDDFESQGGWGMGSLY